jgi:hypothetical protein
VGPVSARKSELVVYDLHLQPFETAERHTLGLSTDGSRNCQPSRIRSSASVLGGNCGQPYREPVAATEVKHPLIQILTRLPTLKYPLTGESAGVLQAWLLKEAANFQSLLNGGPGLISQGLSEAKLTGILTWLFMTALERERATSDESVSIPLARVWARLTTTSVEVLWIDESAPYRRTLDCHGPQFSIDQWRGKHVDSAKAAAALCGIDLCIAELPASINQLTTHLDNMIKDRPHKLYVIVDNNKLIAPFPATLEPQNGDPQQAP